MKKAFLSLLFFTLNLNSIWSIELPEKSQKISFSVAIVDPHTDAGELRPRSLTMMPEVWFGGNALYFFDVFSSTVPVVIVDSNDEVVFSDYLYCGADKIMLPASLTGTFTVYMRVGTILYYGTFNV